MISPTKKGMDALPRGVDVSPQQALLASPYICLSMPKGSKVVTIVLLFPQITQWHEASLFGSSRAL